MKETTNSIADDVVVAMTYILTVNGEELDRADEDDPMLFLQGHGNIIPGLEDALYGMEIGDSKEVSVAPEDAYGVVDPDSTDVIPLDVLPEGYEPEVGDPLQLRDTESGQIFEVYVSDVSDGKVTVDFNHPLAGETLQFAVKIVDLRPATTEELAHGHVHEHGHSH